MYLDVCLRIAGFVPIVYHPVNLDDSAVGVPFNIDFRTSAKPDKPFLPTPMDHGLMCWLLRRDEAIVSKLLKVATIVTSGAWWMEGLRLGHGIELSECTHVALTGFLN